MPSDLKVTRHDFVSRPDLASALAGDIADHLTRAIEARGAATLAVSGGTTPTAMLRRLSKEAVDWSRVTVTLVDERFVPMESNRSNARLVRETLLEGAANAASFLPLYSPAPSAEEAASAANNLIEVLRLPLDVVVLGMGTDGHTASFFADAAEIEQLLDMKTHRLVAAANAPSAGEARLTLTLPPIATARYVALHIEGEAKKAALDQALADGSRLPIRRVIDAAASPVEIFWAA